jgi:flagellar biosynthesis regulator FlbT
MKMYDIEIQKVLDNLNVIHEIYDTVRVVDPVKKRPVGGNDFNQNNQNCYDIWENNEICRNCISIRASFLNKALFKLEHTNDKIYMVTAIPVELPDRRVVIELLKDVTESMLMETEKKQKLQEMRIFIDNINQMVIKDSLTNVYNKRYIHEKLPVDMI